MKLIQFVKNSGPYSPGDSAGFAAADADAYVARGDAVEIADLVDDIEQQEDAADEVTGDGTGEALPEIVEGQGIQTAPARKSRK